MHLDGALEIALSGGKPAGKSLVSASVAIAGFSATTDDHARPIKTPMQAVEIKPGRTDSIDRS